MGSDTNSEIQAAHHILELFETAKANSDSILDGMPGIFCIMASDGTIFRGNQALGEAMAVGIEHLLGRSFMELLSPEDGNQFKINLEQVRPSPPSVAAPVGEFEMAIRSGNTRRSLIWNLSPLDLKHQQDIRLVTVIGKDITDLKRLTGQKARMEVELKTAQVVQETLLPRANADLGKVVISGSCRPASECGGDWWYYFQVGWKVFLIIGDVVGHGVSAALITAAVRAQFSVLSDYSKTSTSDLLKKINSIIYEMTSGRQTMTMLVACLDTQTYKFTYANAAHVAWIHVPANAKLQSASELGIKVTGPTFGLGSTGAAAFKEFEMKVAPGDMIFFCTDGIFDVVNPSDLAIGKKKIYQMLTEALSFSRVPKDAVKHLDQAVQDFRAGTELVDDVTFFIAKVV